MNKSSQHSTTPAPVAKLANELSTVLSESTNKRIRVVQVVKPKSDSNTGPDLALELDVAGTTVELAVSTLRFAYAPPRLARREFDHCCDSAAGHLSALPASAR
nr:hypothetical protein [uncultured Cupriavidus sp.]